MRLIGDLTKYTKKYRLRSFTSSSFNYLYVLQASLIHCSNHINPVWSFYTSLDNIMLLRSNKHSSKLLEVILSPPAPTLRNSALPRRLAQTARTKKRSSTPSANKTISLKPDPHNSSLAPRMNLLNMEHSDELLPKGHNSFEK